MVSSFLMLLRPKQSHKILQNVGRVGFFNGRSLFQSHHPKSENSRIFMPVQMSIREFRVTNPRKASSPIFYVMYPNSGIFAIILALLVRRLWLKMGPKETGIIWAKSRKWLKQIGLVGISVSTFLILLYFDHTDETPMTKRKRFIFMNKELKEELLRDAEEMEIERWRGAILPESHRLYKRTRRVLEKILSANSDVISEFQNREFRLVIINEPDIANAMALPYGTIAVFSGILRLSSNNDILATVLSHEVAHQILGHYWEDLNRLVVARSILCLSSFVLWLVFTKLRAFVFTSLIWLLGAVFVARSRRVTEEEADLIGIFLSAKSCFDVREAVKLWSCLHRIEGYDIPEWLSTHPSIQQRVRDMRRLLPYALELRSIAGCPDLNSFESFVNKYF